MFPGEIPGRSRLELLGRRRGAGCVFRNGWRQCVTQVNHFYNGLEKLAKAARVGAIPGGVIHDGGLTIDRLTAEAPEGADELILDLYKRLPKTRITDILMEVDAEVSFTDAFIHLRTGAPCQDKIGLLNVLLAEGINLSLGKMAEATNTHDYWELMRLSRWHVEGEAMDRALAMLIEAQAKLPMAAFWGPGTTASSDGQFFPTTRQGEAMNLVNARYGSEPGLKAYTHVSDRFGPFATQIIPATVNETPYILDGLLMNETGRRIREQYADTGGFTDHVFSVTSILGYRFVPRIRDLPSKRIYVFEPAACPKELRGLIGGRLRQSLIASNWPDVLRLGATLAAGMVAPSLILRKLAACPRRNDLAAALREVGRVERTLFMIDWALDPAMQRRVQIGLNKGESHHALKSALRIGRQGEIRDRTTTLQRLYGYRPFEGSAREEMCAWLVKAGEDARANDDLAASMLEELRCCKIIAPAPSTIERLCADALVAAERVIAARIAGRLDPALRGRLSALLSETVTPEPITRFVWLRTHEAGSNSNVANRLLDQLAWVRELGVSMRVLDDIPPHRIARLRRQDERYYADGLRDLPEERRLAILAVCAPLDELAKLIWQREVKTYLLKSVLWYDVLSKASIP